MVDNALDRIRVKVNKAADKAVSRIERQALAKIVANDIKTRTRLGKGVFANDHTTKKLKKLSDSYKKQRKYLRKRGELSSATTPSKSNLTKTGQLLNSLSGRARSYDEIEIYLKEGRDDGEKNSAIVGYQEKQARPFFYISKYERERLTRLVRKLIDRQLKRDL